MLICAALCSGTTRIGNLLESEDILLTKSCLEKMGAEIKKIDGYQYEVVGFSGTPAPYKDAIYLGNSGTSMRLLAAIAALGETPYVLTGNERMCQRPMQELLDALNILDITAASVDRTGAPPVKICGGKKMGGKVKIDCTKSSQYLSALMMIAPFFNGGFDITMDEEPVSSPYIQLTCDIMEQFGVSSEKISPVRYKINGPQTYQPGRFAVEPDLSNAGYFWAIGAVTGAMIYVDNIKAASLQGDLKQVDILEKMGCKVVREPNRIGVMGTTLKGIEVDMADTPDAVPAIAVVASFAKGTTLIRNIAHLREKECDRIDAVVTQLQNLGIDARQGDDYIRITGGPHRAAQIHTYNDHRIAMAFSIPGLITHGIEIENETCVEKSFPSYWRIFDAL